MPRGMYDLSSPTGDRTQAPALEAYGVLTTGPPGKAQGLFLLK